MICPQCSNLMVKSYMLQGEEFDYCRTCKKELSEMQKTGLRAIIEDSSNSMFNYSRAFYNKCPVIQNNFQFGTELAVPLNFQLPVGHSPATFGLSNKVVTFVILIGSVDLQFPPVEWICYSPLQPGGTFHGVDRSLDQIRLAGLSWDGVGQSIKDSVLHASRVNSMEGGHAESLFLNPIEFKELEDEFVFTNAKIPGMHILTISGMSNLIMAYPDVDVPKGFGYLLQMDTWRRDTKFGTYCTAPGYNVVIRFK